MMSSGSILGFNRSRFEKEAPRRVTETKCQQKARTEKQEGHARVNSHQILHH